MAGSVTGSLTLTDRRSHTQMQSRSAFPSPNKQSLYVRQRTLPCFSGTRASLAGYLIVPLHHVQCRVMLLRQFALHIRVWVGDSVNIRSLGMASTHGSYGQALTCDVSGHMTYWRAFCRKTASFRLRTTSVSVKQSYVYAAIVL